MKQPRDQPPPLVGSVAALGAGGLAGACTGVLHARLKVPALLAGILTMTGLYSVNLRVMGRPNVALLRMPTLIEGVQELGIGPRWAALALFVVASLVLAGGLYWFLRTEVGLALRATGDNEGMASSSGIETGWTKTLGLAVSNALVSFSGRSPPSTRASRTSTWGSAPSWPASLPSSWERCSSAREGCGPLSRRPWSVAWDTGRPLPWRSPWGWPPAISS
ncbi:MAG: hypothetical protein IMX02_01015 [Limnochordaceae bacterium]|nr:hypothetical protein [Limnochordaceae bacterium]